MKQLGLSLDNHATAAVVQYLSDCAVAGLEGLILKTTRSFEVDSSHMTVSSQVKSFQFAQVELRSTWGHFSFTWGHIDHNDS